MRSEALFYFQIKTRSWDTKSNWLKAGLFESKIRIRSLHPALVYSVRTFSRAWSLMMSVVVAVVVVVVWVGDGIGSWCCCE
jgi:hypothetical protein